MSAVLTGSFSGSLTGSGATVTVSTPLLNLTQTWNAAGVTFTGALVNVTDTASAGGSLLLDLQLAGATKFNVGKFGAVYTPSTVQADQGFKINSDVILTRDAANTLSLRNGVNANSLKVGNTYTDASNNEYGVFDWVLNSNSLTIGTTKAGTGVNRAVQFMVGGTNVFNLASSSGNMLWNTDNTFDIGAAGASRPKNIFIAGAFSGVSLGVSGTVQSTGGSVQANTFLKSGAVLVSALPSAATAGVGARYSVTDSTATTFNAIVAGGGANGVPVTSDGTNWRIG